MLQSHTWQSLSSAVRTLLGIDWKILSINKLRCYEAKYIVRVGGCLAVGLKPTAGLFTFLYFHPIVSKFICFQHEARYSKQQQDNYQPPQTSVCTAQMELSHTRQLLSMCYQNSVRGQPEDFSTRTKTMLSGFFILNAENILLQLEIKRLEANIERTLREVKCWQLPEIKPYTSGLSCHCSSYNWTTVCPHNSL